MQCSECNACWGQLRSEGAAVPAAGTVVWMDPLPTPNITSAPALVKCQLLISSSGWAGSEAVAWAQREIELIWNDNHRLSAFIGPEKVAVLRISQAVCRLKVENSKCLGGFHLASPGWWGKPHSRGCPGLFAYPSHHFHLQLHSLTTSLAHRMLVLAPILLAATLVKAEAEAEAEADPAILAHGYAEVAYCANGGYCVPPVHCAPYYLESLYDPAAPCYLAHGTPGVCCPPQKAPCK